MQQPSLCQNVYTANTSYITLTSGQKQFNQRLIPHLRQRCKAHYQCKKHKLYTLAQELKKLRATEELCQIYCNINYAVGKDKLAGILLVIAPDHIECTSKDNIKDGCIYEGQQQFHQTAGTPLMTAPLNIQLGYLGIGKEYDCILNDHYKSKPGTNQYAQLLLKWLSRVAPGRKKNWKPGSQLLLISQAGKKPKKIGPLAPPMFTSATAKLSCKTWSWQGWKQRFCPSQC
jgi:hypothetical protein